MRLEKEPKWNDDGFTKTTIPLKNIFSASLVSRSQARRYATDGTDLKKLFWTLKG